MKMKTVIFISAIAFLITGCATKVRVKAIQPAQIYTDTKKIAVTDFSNDRVNLSSKIEAKISNRTFDGKPYFTTLSRQDLDKVLNEQRIQSSGLLDPSTAIEVGNIMGAEAIISGNVSDISSNDTSFYEKRTKCDKDKCWEVKVRCMKRLSSLSSDIRMIDTKKGDIIYADTISKYMTSKHCSDDSKVILSSNMAAQRLAQDIADSFVYKLLPHYVYFNVELLEDGDLDYSDTQEKLLKNSIEYIKQNRYDKAERLLTQLIESTDEKSYVAIYDLGVLKEAQGKYDEAKSLYYKADNLVTEPVEEISRAINHIQTLIEQNEQALRQINN